MDRSQEHVYTVVGMTCGHCRAAVADEVGAVRGVKAVEVDLESGRLTVTGVGVSGTAVVDAVVEAGYAVRPA